MPKLPKTYQSKLEIVINPKRRVSNSRLSRKKKPLRYFKKPWAVYKKDEIAILDYVDKATTYFPYPVIVKVYKMKKKFVKK